VSKQVLKIIDNAMSTLGIEYGFVSYKKFPVVYPYFVGEYTETEPFREDGLRESTFLLTGFHRGTWLELEDAKERIEQYFDSVSGKVAVAEDGSAAAIFYANALIVPTGDAELKSVQINLSIKEWKVK
jgi:hypothetical protein